MRWCLLAILLLAVSPAGAVDTVTLREAFDRVVFGTGLPGGRDALLRVDDPWVEIEVYGEATPDRLAVLSELAADLAALSGLAVDVIPTAGPAPPLRPVSGLAHFQLHIVGREGFAALLDQPWIPPGLRAGQMHALCSFVTQGRQTIRGALILVDATLPEATLRHCLVEETAQAFGAIDDTTLLDPSAFNDWGTLIERLQPDDRRILQALYDPRLHAGMSRAEVLELLPGILGE